MQQFRKKPNIVKAAQWFKNGDHPLDYAKTDSMYPSPEVRKHYGWEGEFVQKYTPPTHAREKTCPHCGHLLVAHGYLDASGYIVCPGDWIITDSTSTYPCRPDTFMNTYEPI